MRIPKIIPLFFRENFTRDFHVFFPFPWQNLWFCRFAARLKGHPLRELRSDTDDGIKCGAAGGSGKHHRTIGEPPGLAMVATRKVREGTPKWAH